MTKPWLFKQHRYGRPGDCRQRIENAQHPPEWQADQPACSDRTAPTRSLQQDQGQNDRVGGEFDPARLKRGQGIAAERNARQEPEQDGKHSSPNHPHALQIDEEDVNVDEDLDDDNGGVENAIGVEN
ncbi:MULTISPECIES: hypothetical protein [unclassified Bradyrhizobium]|uniref:hypothetical protein n=1 Tax=unclassified Bradyrhizobium TaxID=2631580 RepID=UPI001CD31C02|nr:MULTISPECIES: hypothetical protein [unclassified Bradyrhizobium]